METFTTQINNRVADTAEDVSKQSLYYDMKEFNALNITKNKNQFSLMHLNISSLQYHFEELNDLLESSKTKFSIIGITESRLKKVFHH